MPQRSARAILDPELERSLFVAAPPLRWGGESSPTDKSRLGISFLPQRNVRTNQYTRLDGCEILGQKRWKRLLG